MKIKWKTLILCIAIPLILGSVVGSLSNNSMAIFAALNKPPLSPPGWLFPVVWTMLYTLMGIASYLVLTSGAAQQDVAKALQLYTLQLLLNLLWTFWFFHLGLYWFSFLWLVVLWFLILMTTILFADIAKPAAYLLLPYLAWVAFAGYLNLGIAILN